VKCRTAAGPAALGIPDSLDVDQHTEDVMPRALSSSIVAALCLGCGAAFAQGYPDQPVRIVLGFPPASTPDVITRILAEPMNDDLGQPVLVENRPGASGAIAAQSVARAAADGYTLMVDGCSATGTVYSFVLQNRRPLDPFKDFTPVGRLSRDHWIVAARPRWASIRCAS
jgi:tripartite-type tricarboxylate transporter receptor subunit TctC